MSVLADIVDATRGDVLRRATEMPLPHLHQEALARLQLDPPVDVASALRTVADVAVIAEIKRRSPSAGLLAEIADVTTIAREYERGGASMISVLTEPHWFGGSLADLSTVAQAVQVPVLRKDFIIDRYQVAEACAAGADALLLIVAALSDAELTDLLAEAERWHMTALVEVHDEDEARRAAACGATVIGVNARNLASLSVDTDTFARVVGLLPSDAVKVAESGLRDAADVAKVVRAGADAVLIGQALVQSASPAQTIQEMKEAARHAR